MAFTGFTTIEYWGGKRADANNNSQSEGYRQYNSINFWDNFEQIFGTSKILKILKPTFKKMPHDGIKWSKHTGDLESGNEEASNIVMTN